MIDYAQYILLCLQAQLYIADKFHFPTSPAAFFDAFATV